MRTLGVDIGGTKMKWGIISGGEMLCSGELPSRASEGREMLLATLFELLDGLDFELVGISTAGIVAPDGSVAYANGNIPNYTATPLRALVEERYGVRAFVLNDIAAAAYSELDPDRLDDDFYYLALGTGVGGIHVKGGEAQRGAGGVAGQVGYLRSYAGGEVDLDASSRGLARLSPDGDPRRLFSSVAEGDADAERILRDWLRCVAYLIVEIIGFTDPRRIIIGGGISEQGERLLSPLRAELDSLLPEPYRTGFTLSVARGGNYAGVIGAVRYALLKNVR